MPALVPLIYGGGWTQGVLAVKSTTKVTVALVLGLLAGVATAPLWWPALPGLTSNASGEAPPELIAPPFEQPRTEGAAMSRPAQAESRTEIAVAPPETEETGIFAARLIDSLTGEVVPHFAVEVEQGERSAAVVSDELGELVTETTFVAGILELFLDDHPGVLRNVELQMGEGVMERGEPGAFGFRSLRATTRPDGRRGPDVCARAHGEARERSGRLLGRHTG